MVYGNRAGDDKFRGAKHGYDIITGAVIRDATETIPEEPKSMRRISVDNNLDTFSKPSDSSFRDSDFFGYM